MYIASYGQSVPPKEDHRGNTVHVSVWVGIHGAYRRRLHTHRLTTSQEDINNVDIRGALDLLPFFWSDALLRETFDKLRVARLHDRTVKLHPIRVRDLVLHRTKVVARVS